MFNVFKEIYDELLRKNLNMKLPLIAIFLLLISCGCSYINEKMHLKDDNDIEEIVEELIHQKTGLDLDLTPSTKE
jgi:hypothetical protein